MAAFRTTNSSKQAGEAFFWWYSLVWMGVMAAVVQMKVYESFTPTGYIAFATSVAAPCILIPLFFPSKEDRHSPIMSRYVIKANLYIGVLGLLANHFFTHYFYNVLGVKYTGPVAPDATVSFNNVPICMHLMTHPYFCSYHSISTPLLRLVKSYTQRSSQWISMLCYYATVCSMALLTAWLETWTISSFPYYTYPDFDRMLTTGSVFYGLFFLVSFPMFARLDEKMGESWSWQRVVIEALASMMMILTIADVWRLIAESRVI